MQKNFYNEKEMGEFFKNYIERLNKSSQIFLYEECKSLFGIPDFVIVEKNKSTFSFIISIELKIKNWKRALIQAYRYKSFSNIVFVVIDEKYVKNAEKNIDYFKKFNIGLASFSKSNNLKVIFLPRYDLPFSNHYLADFTQTLDENVSFKALKHRSILSNLLIRYAS